MHTLARRDDIAGLTAGYGLIVADECHHVPAAAFADAVRQIPARRWLGPTATPYRRDKLDDRLLYSASTRPGTATPEMPAGPHRAASPSFTRT
jgi:superfamily II DNA or RNA helicase